MQTIEVRSELEAELTWRRTELRVIRNRLLFPVPDGEDLDRVLRTLVVLQYAHLEGFAKQALGIYASAINAEAIPSTEANRRLVASGLVVEIDALRSPAGGEAESGDGPKMRRARREVDFVDKLFSLIESHVVLNVDEVVSLDMNLSADVLKRCLFRLGIDPERISSSQYAGLEFVRRMRNSVAHGGRTRPVPKAEFDAHVSKTNDLMEDLVRLVHQACKWGWFRRVAA